MPKGDNPTPKQKKFARVYVDTGNLTEAAAQAYDVKHRDSARTLGTQNLAKRSVKQLIESYAPKAALRVEELCAQEKNLNVALGAAKDILDRAGYKPVDKQATAIQGDINISWGGGGGYKEPNE